MNASGTLLAAVSALRSDRPADYLAVLAHVSGIIAQCRVDTETFTLTCAERSIMLTPDAAPDLQIAISRATLIALVDGDISLLSAIKTRHLYLIGPTAMLARLSRAQRHFAMGAARSRRVQRVFDGFRTPG